MPQHRLLRFVVLCLAFLPLGGLGSCPLEERVSASRSLYYDVTLNGEQVEVRLDQNITYSVVPFARALAEDSSVQWDVQLWIRDPATGEFRLATPEERTAIYSQIYVPPWHILVGHETIGLPPSGTPDRIPPRPPPPPPVLD